MLDSNYANNYTNTLLQHFELTVNQPVFQQPISITFLYCQFHPNNECSLFLLYYNTGLLTRKLDVFKMTVLTQKIFIEDLI